MHCADCPCMHGLLCSYGSNGGHGIVSLNFHFVGPRLVNAFALLVIGKSVGLL